MPSEIKALFVLVPNAALVHSFTSQPHHHPLSKRSNVNSGNFYVTQTRGSDRFPSDDASFSVRSSMTRLSSTALHMARLPFVSSSRTVILVSCFATWLFGYLTGRRAKRQSRRAFAGSSIVSKDGIDDKFEQQGSDDDENQVPVWLNFAIGRMWGLFQTNTKRLVSDTMQPILDAADKPQFVKDVVLTNYYPGKQAPLIQSVKRLPSRAMAEVQYSMRMTFASTSVTTFLVHCALGPLEIAIPVTMKNLDLDANVWIGSTLAPYEPFCTTVEYALLSKPAVRFDLTLARVLPITTLPVLRNLFIQLLTNDIPKRFVLPNVTKLDFTPETIQMAIARDRQSANAATLITRADSLNYKALRAFYPEKWALFDAMDQDENGSLSFDEIKDGLEDWGYTASDSMETFRRLDTDNDGQISFQEFCHWQITPFISTDYAGELIVLIRQILLEGTSKRPRFLSDPRVAITVNGATENTKWRSQLTISEEKDDNYAGEVLFMQSFDFKCQDPADETLQIAIQERWPARNVIAIGEIPLSTILRRRNQKRKVRLEFVNRSGGGYVWLDLSYAEFVNFDRQEQEVISKSVTGTVKEGL